MEGEKVIKYDYLGGYWECREKGEWPNDILDLYN